MRITNQMMINNAIQHMSENLDKINTLSERVATQKQFQTASDDPVSASYCLSLRSTLKTTDAYRSTAGLVDDWMSENDIAFEQMQALGNRAVNLIQRGLNDTNGPDERKAAMASEMTELIKQAVDVGNQSVNGQYLFSGSKVDTIPFSMPDANTVAYRPGDTNLMFRSIGPGQKVQMNVDGEATFLPFMQYLIQARNALSSNDTTTLRTTLSQVQSSLVTMNEGRTANGARQKQVQTVMDYLDKVDIDVKSLLSKKEDANMAESISLLQGQQTTYQSVIEVSQRAISALNLFDYLK